MSDELRPFLIDERWIEERIERWCGVPRALVGTLDRDALLDMVRNRSHGSSLFTAKVRGIFPDSAAEGVIPLGWITQAVNRWKALQDYDGKPSLKATAPGPRIVGVDVARTGNDETCLAVRYGSYIPELHRMRVTDTMEVANRVAAYMHEPGAIAAVDVIGIGAGVYDRLRQMKNAAEIIGTPIMFNASRQSGRKDKLGQFTFFNDRAAAWWNLREKLDPAFGSQLALPDDEEMIEELAAPKFDLYANGRLKVESKDDIKRRIGRSTDSADAVIQAFWIDGTTFDGEFVPYHDTPVGATRGGVYDYQQDPEEWGLGSGAMFPGEGTRRVVPAAGTGAWHGLTDDWM